jgi:nitroimidazol reductase NimA-like FMN-containing flavoprotein (pyridoxamine 5'-phosphate oxidase superfamily)
MRRKDREITDTGEIESIIASSDVCRLAIANGNTPYIVTMNFGFKGGTEPCLYFHCAGEGRKIEMIRKNNHVCFEMDTDHELYEGEKGCDWGMKFRSVVGYGDVYILKDNEEKIRGLDFIMAHYSERSDFQYDKRMIEKTSVIRLDITEMTGKKR